MNAKEIESKLVAIRDEHTKLVDKIEELTKEQQNLISRRIFLEGKFESLNELYKELQSKESDDLEESKSE